jgi:hypothetical protein
MDQEKPLVLTGIKAADFGKANDPKAIVQHTMALSIQDWTLVSITALDNNCMETTRLHPTSQGVVPKAISGLTSASKRKFVSF